MKSSKFVARILSTVLVIMMLFSLVTVGFTVSAAEVETAPTGNAVTAGLKLYLTPNSNWKSDNARFAIYLFGAGEAWVSMTKVAGETDLYEATVPGAGYTGIIFCRMNPSNTTNSWNTKWNQSEDLTWNGTNNHWTVKAGAWDKGGGTWSTYTPFVAATVPATPAAATVTLVGATAGNGTEAEPYQVAPASTLNFTITGVVGEATGLAYAVNSTTKTDIAAGQASALYSTTAPATGESAELVVSLWAYNDTGTDKAYSATAATTTVYVTAVEAEVEEPGDDITFALPYEVVDGLYAYAGTEVAGVNAWQRWTNVNSVRNFYLPASASDTEVIVYNTYSTAVMLNGVIINAGEYATVPYVDGTTYTCSGATTQSVKIQKTDAEGTLFMNAQAETTYKKDDGTKGNLVDLGLGLYDFMVSGTKNQETGKVGGAVASEQNGVQDDVVIKKLKGRGNSTWRLDKKPFNITYDSTIEIDGMKGKKWSLLANAQDPSLIRNRLVYDLANEVGMVYACDSRFVDVFVDGSYKGSYQFTQKIEMGKNTVMPDLTEPEVEDVVDEETGETIPYPTENFDFILELDTKENADSSGDLGFYTTLNQWMTFKTPDEPADEQIAFIQAKYQAVENALYGNDLATLATLVDINDFARAYLVNEVAKNLDSGVTSCYFVYDSANNIFRMSPVWDYDNALGNSVNTDARTDVDGKTLDLKTPAGFYAKELKHYDTNFTGVRSVFSQACYMTSTLEGKTFWDIVKEVWDADFADIDAILAGDAEATGRLQTADDYISYLTKSAAWNYNNWAMTVDNGWISNHSSLAMYSYDAETQKLSASTKSYDQTKFVDQAAYAADWMISRINWLDAALNDAISEYTTIYFENNWSWPDARIHVWGSSDSTANTEWPGTALTKKVGKNADGYDIYEYTIPTDAQGILFIGTGSYGDDQSTDINGGWYDGICYYMTYDSATNTKPCGSYVYAVPEVPTTTTTKSDEPVVPTTTTTKSDEPEVPVTTTTKGGEPAADTITVYFSNAWAWTDVCVYTWDAENTPAVAWPGTAMTFVEKNDLNQDIYKATIPANSVGMIFNGKDNGSDAQSPDLTDIRDGYGYYMNWTEELGVHVGMYEYIAKDEPASSASSATAAATTTTKKEEVVPSSSSQGGDTPDMPAVVTVYAINSAKWADVYAYAWDAAGTPAVVWPGTAMDKTEETVNGFDVYALSFNSEYANVIFNNNNNGSQTDNLTVMDGQYYDIKGKTWYASLADVPALDATATDVYLVGAFNSWSTTANEFKRAEAGAALATVTMDLEAATTYEFKIVREGAWTSNATPITATVTGLTFSSSVSDNATITTTEAGTYTFTWTVAASQLTVTYPGDETPEIVIPGEPEPDTTVKLAGSFTDWGDGALEMTADETGKIYTISDIRLDAGMYEFKIVEFGTWMGNKGTIENVTEGGWTFKAKDDEGNDLVNCKLNTKGGVYTFTFDTETDKLTVTAVLDKLVYDVTWNEGNFTVNAPASIDEATDLTFTIDAAEGYIVSAVICDMKLIEAVDGVYTIANVQKDIELLVITAQVVTEPEVMTFTVTFVDKDGNTIDTQTVEYGNAAVAPEYPVVDGYNFTGWDTDFDFVTKDITVKATYKKIAAPVVPATTGKLRLELAGGTSFTIAVNGGNARPQGASYVNTKMAIGAEVELVADTTNGLTFLGWMNEAGAVVSTTETFKFYTSGNDYYKAVYQTEVEGANVVIFKNSKAMGGNGQILEMQYYAAGDEITYPDAPSAAGYNFVAWNMTADDIQAALAAGQDVVVDATWEIAKTYVNVTVNGGTVSTAAEPNGQYLAFNAVTVVADAAPAGQKFAYWTDAEGNVASYKTTYKFFPAADVELTAVFVAKDETVELKPILTLSGNPTAYPNEEKITYTLAWDVDASIGTVTGVGVIIVDKADYNEATFVHGTTDSKVFDRAFANKVAQSGEYAPNKSASLYDHTYVAAMWIQYRDAVTGENETIYSANIEVYKPAP